MFNILEGLLTVILVNARHIKAVPGRKTDVRDCEWLADLVTARVVEGEFYSAPGDSGTARAGPVPADAGDGTHGGGQSDYRS